MKWNKNIILVLVLVLILIAGGIFAGVIYTKQQTKIEMLSNQQAVSDTLITSLHNQNQIYNDRISEDSIKLIDNTKRIDKLLMQRSMLNLELLKAKKAIIKLTSNESINYFINYTGATGSRMYAVDSDTALIVANNGVRKADSIFIEHAFYRTLTPKLDSIIAVQNSDIEVYSHSIVQYQLLLVNKDKEIAHSQETTNAMKTEMQQIIDKVKIQRNIAGGSAFVFLGLTVLLII